MDTMGNEPQVTTLPLVHATVILQSGGVKQRFRVETATLTPQGKRDVRLTFEGPHGSVAIDLTRTVFWRFTNLFHDRSTAIDFDGSMQRRPRGKRS